jgi:ubiquinone/menaquinone biosynthesis C-methylase UbiE
VNIQSLKPKIKRIIPFPLYFVARKVYHDVYLPRRYERFARDDAAHLAEFGIHDAPPPRLRHRTHGAPDLPSFLRQGRRQVDAIRQGLDRCGRTFADVRTVLDFGCGCGRTALWLRKEYPHLDYHGVDLDSESIQWALGHANFGSFQVSSPVPPLPFAESRFDLIFSISVFTHLPEDLAGQWLRELRRIVKPGGLVFLSVHSETAAEHLAPRQRLELRARGICHTDSGAMSRIFADFYQNTYHTHDYLIRTWGALFDILGKVSLGVQDLVLMQRPHDS